MADASDLESDGAPCRFKSCRPHQAPDMLWHIGGLAYNEKRQDLRVEAIARAIGLRRRSGKQMRKSRKLNSTVCCSPGRAAKGASPVVRTKSV